MAIPDPEHIEYLYGSGAVDTEPYYVDIDANAHTLGEVYEAVKSHFSALEPTMPIGGEKIAPGVYVKQWATATIEKVAKELNLTEPVNGISIKSDLLNVAEGVSIDG